MFRRNCSTLLLVLLPLTLAPVLSARAEEVAAAFLPSPDPGDAEARRAAPDAAQVSEVLRLPPAAVVAAERLAKLSEQHPGPGVPYQDGFQRSAPRQQVRISTQPVAWQGESRGELVVSGQTRASWLGRFVVEGSHAFRIRLDDVQLPKGTRIWVFADGVQLGPFGDELIDPEGGVWLPPAPGPEQVVEVQLPDDPPLASELRFAVGEVMEIVETAAGSAATPRAWSDCDVDAMCVSTSSLSTIDILREATARLSFVKGGGSYLCSGGLVNDKDTSGFRPYLLTANHCFNAQSSASSLVAYFDYRTNGCNGSVPSLWTVPSVSGSTLLATNAVSDFTFVELTGNPTGNTWYLGWTTTDPAFGTSMYRVSHPAGSTQRYSASSFTGSSGITCGGLSTADFHYSASFSGATAGGSSGSPVTVAPSTGDARIVGQLYGVCHLSSWDDCNYSTYNLIDGAFSTTFPSVNAWLNVPGTCEDSYEPDDAAGAASLIVSGSGQDHSLCPAGDEDWVYFTLPSQSAILLETSGASGDTRMWLYDSSLSQLEFDDDGGASLFSRIERTCAGDPLAAGTYYVKVDEFGDDDAIPQYDLSYDLVASCGGGGCPVNTVLSNTSISGTASYRASNTVTLGPSLVVDGTSVDVIAGQRVVIANGTEIGGSFAAGTHPSACTL